MSTTPYGLTSPCADCPFRTDIEPYLTSERVSQIKLQLTRAEFSCHKTCDYSAENGQHIRSTNEMHCAGALILLEKIELPSQMMRIAERLGLYDASKLNMDAPVFDSFEEMAQAQPGPPRRSRKKK